MTAGPVTFRKDDAPAVTQAAITNVAAVIRFLRVADDPYPSWFDASNALIVLIGVHFAGAPVH